ncbi:YkvA family protein [Pigmentiphaga soli]|uniref:YkvA family protein n=2 Tax=Pigmentiphaga soli TaxID=1007095 RepID=A0ABP8GHU0_9BURK
MRRLARHARGAGAQVVEKVLWLYYAAQDPATPRWARTAIYGALGYFILPLDAVPDFIPGVGFGDDLSLLVTTMAATALYVTDDVKAKARQTMAGWFGDTRGVR